tara:strand:- start:197 stop:1081 length:885 start_codon:yes stop_codon:yes gene_type:complete
MLSHFKSMRISSGLAAGLFGLVFVSLGGWWFTIAVSVIVHLALLEYFRMAKYTGIRPAVKTTITACHLLLITTQCGIHGGFFSSVADAVLPLSGAVICGWLLLQPITGSISDIAASVFGLFYLGFLPSHWIRLRNLTDINLTPGIDTLSIHFSEFFTPGMAITLGACFMIVASDIGSYILGSKFGNRPLSRISPGKTVEGALGGALCVMFIGAISGEIFNWKFGYLIGSSLGVLVALFALIGDLTESMMKRNAGLKDSGDALPGHGGILDRIDSYLFTPAVVYYFVIIVLPLIN